MAGNTANLSIPYPTASDKLSGYPAVAQQAAGALDTALTNPFASQYVAGASQTSFTAAEASTFKTLVTVTVELEKACRVNATGVGIFRPVGNAQGIIKLMVDGVEINRGQGHSRSTSYPMTIVSTFNELLTAGTHTISLQAGIAPGSNASTFDYPTLAVTP